MENNKHETSSTSSYIPEYTTVVYPLSKLHEQEFKIIHIDK